MKLILSALIVLSTSIASAGSFGVSPAQQILKKKTGMSAPRAKVKGCVNFTGYWVGGCRIELEGSDPIDFPAEVKITQHECDALDSNGEVQPIGGNVASSASGQIEGAAFALADDNQFDWNEDKSALVVRSHTVVRPLGGTALIFDAVGASVIEGGKLLFGQEAPGFKMGCAYDRH